MHILSESSDGILFTIINIITNTFHLVVFLYFLISLFRLIFFSVFPLLFFHMFFFFSFAFFRHILLYIVFHIFLFLGFFSGIPGLSSTILSFLTAFFVPHMIFHINLDSFFATFFCYFRGTI